MDQERDHELAEMASAKIRMGIAMQRHARQCPWCAVITQNGKAGANLHRQVLHPGRALLNEGVPLL